MRFPHRSSTPLIASRHSPSAQRPATNRRAGRQQTPESITRRLHAIEVAIPDVDVLARLHLIEKQTRLEAELADQDDDATDLPPLEGAFIAVVTGYSDQKGISYSTWRAVGVSAVILRQAGVARTRG